MMKMPWMGLCRTACLGLALNATAPLVFAQNDANLPADSPLATQPTSAEGHFDAALLMMRLARPELARYHVEKLLEANPEDALLIKLRDEHGTSTFLQLAGNEDLNPPATDLLNLLNEAVRKQVGTPGYADALIRKLAGSSRENEEAINELRHLGPYAVPPLLNALDGTLGVERVTITVTLARLGSDAVPPLIGALKSPDPDTRAVAAEVLGIIGADEDEIWLLHPAFSESELPGVQASARQAIARIRYGSQARNKTVSGYGAANRLLSTAVQHLNGTYKWSDLLDEGAPITIWTWDPAQSTVVEYQTNRRNASNYFAERLAREAADLAPDNVDTSVVLLSALLQRDITQAGWDQPVPTGPGSAHQLMVESGPDMTAGVLRFAIENQLPAAQLAAIRALALNGSTALLHGQRGASPILDALDSPYPRIQFEAAVTILNWEPTEPFRKSSRVIEILARALNSDARAEGVVFDPNISRATTTAGIFGELGFNTRLAATGMDGFRIAAARGNIELAVLHPNVIRWELSQTIENLRADSRTAEIPVVIYGPAAGRKHYESVAARYEKVVFIQQANTALELNKNLRPVLAGWSPPPMTPQQLANQKAEAAFWLRRIATTSGGSVFDLAMAEEELSAAVNRPEVAEDAIIALGGVGRPSAQELLAGIVTAPAAATNLRSLAALQLAYHIQRYGNLLKEDDASSLRQTFANETDPNVLSAIGGVIGSLKPTPAAVRQRLLSRPLSPAPVVANPANPAET